MAQDKLITGESLSSAFYERIRGVLSTARSQAAQAVNWTMVEAYWQIGRLIVEEEQQGQSRAEYGTRLMEILAKRLVKEFGKGYEKRNLQYFRQFYLTFPKVNALRAELSWTHYRELMRVKDEQARQWYLKEATEQGWSYRALARQINVLFYERLLASQFNQGVKQEGEEKVTALAAQPLDFIRDPYVLEFLGLQGQHSFYEQQLEEALLSNLQSFLLELGKGFAFVARQKRITAENTHFFVDLVFYNYILKCFVLVDLKVGELSHQDLGQMDMYVRMYEELYKQPGDNPTIGLILCSEKNETVVKYSFLSESKQLFVSKYMSYLPTEEELRAELLKDRQIIEREKRLKPPA